VLPGLPQEPLPLQLQRLLGPARRVPLLPAVPGISVRVQLRPVRARARPLQLLLRPVQLAPVPLLYHLP
jgi:hypothetical protein